MNWKVIASAVLVAWLSDMVVKQFTSGTDTDTERLIWRLGSAAAVGVVASKLL